MMFVSSIGTLCLLIDWGHGVFVFELTQEIAFVMFSPMVNKSAQNLGRLAKGVPKRQTPEHKEKLRQALAKVRVHRWKPLAMTSYFNCRRIDPARHRVVSVAAYGPRFGARPEATLWKIAPDKAALAAYKAGTMDWNAYMEAYIDKLSAVGHREVVRLVGEQIAAASGEGRVAVLCCHCKDADYCHRTILAAYHGGRFAEL